MVLMSVLSFALVEVRSSGLEYDGVEKGDRVAVFFQYLEREVVLVEMLVYLQFHLSSILSICRQEQDVSTNTMRPINLLLVQ